MIPRADRASEPYFRAQGCSVFADAWRGGKAALAFAVDASRRAGRADLVPIGADQGLEHVHAPKGLVRKERRPVEDLGAPDIGGLHTREPGGCRLAGKVIGDCALDFVAPLERRAWWQPSDRRQIDHFRELVER